MLNKVVKNSLVSTKNSNTNIKCGQIANKHYLIKYTRKNILIDELLLNKYSTVQDIFANECFNYEIKISKTGIDESIEKIFNSKYQRELLDIHLLVFLNLGNIISKAKLVNQAKELKIRSNINYWNYYFIKLIINKKVYYLEFDVRSMDSGENQYRVQRLKKE